MYYLDCVISTHATSSCLIEVDQEVGLVVGSGMLEVYSIQTEGMKINNGIIPWMEISPKTTIRGRGGYSSLQRNVVREGCKNI